jgi:septum formation protein
MPSTRSLVLASASPRRRELLDTLGLHYQVVVPEAAESDDPRLSPSQLVRHNAQLKARAAAAMRRRGVLIGADTVVALGRRCFGKPRDAAHAAQMLRELSGRTHEVFTGVCVIDVDHGRHWTDVVVTRVSFRRLRPSEITRYVRSRAHWDKAGAYAVQDLRALLIDRIDGSLSNVVGLPLHIVQRRLTDCGMLSSA